MFFQKLLVYPEVPFILRLYAVTIPVLTSKQGTCNYDQNLLKLSIEEVSAGLGKMVDAKTRFLSHDVLRH